MALAEVGTLIQNFLPSIARREGAAGASRNLGAAAVSMAKDSLALDPGARMLAAAKQLLATTTDNSYSHIPDIEPEKGIFHADCSELIDFLTSQVKPAALKDLPVDPGHMEPRAWNYYSYLKDRPLVDTPAATGDWGRVGRPAELTQGDVIAWKNEEYVPGHGSTGHVMLVAELPHPVSLDGQLVGFDVPIIDSTSHGHGPGDPRAEGGRSGLGPGTVFFPTDPSGAATGFSWTPAATPGAQPPRNPTLAFGRLLP